MRTEHRYTPRGTTWKPCPCCGKEPKSSYPTAGICYECQATFEWAKGEQARYGALRDMEVRPIPSLARFIDLPYSVGRGSGNMPSQREYAQARDHLAAALMAILESLLLATGGAAEIIRDNQFREGGVRFRGIMPPGQESSGGKHRYVAVRKEHAAAFDRLNAVLLVMIRCAYEAGAHDGRELLTQLANGQITNDKFNENDVALARQVQDAAERAERWLNK